MSNLDIAQAAARLIVDEGMEFGPAKHQALRDLGLHQAALPSNEEVEEQVREHIGIFCSETQAEELLILRQLALVWMKRMHEFRPHLTGAVWSGIATRWSDVYIQLFCDDPKSAEIALINNHVQYEPSTVTGFQGKPVEALSIHALCKPINETVGVHLMVYDHDDMRGAMKPDSRGRSPRGDAKALRKLMEESRDE